MKRLIHAIENLVFGGRVLILAAFVLITAFMGFKATHMFIDAGFEELLPLAEVAMGGEGSAALDSGTNSIVLMGPRSTVERTVSLLRQQDQGP